MNTFAQNQLFMDRQAFLALTSGAQWALFLAVGLIIFSWIERRKIIQQAGHLLFFFLGIFSLWVIFSHQIAVPEVLPNQPAPAEARALTFFSGLLVTACLGLVGFILGLVKSSWAKVVNLVLVPVALFLFFMVYHLQRL